MADRQQRAHELIGKQHAPVMVLIWQAYKGPRLGVREKETFTRKVYLVYHA